MKFLKDVLYFQLQTFTYDPNYVTEERKVVLIKLNMQHRRSLFRTIRGQKREGHFFSDSLRRAMRGNYKFIKPLHTPTHT